MLLRTPARSLARVGASHGRPPRSSFVTRRRRSTLQLTHRSRTTAILNHSAQDVSYTRSRHAPCADPAYAADAQDEGYSRKLTTPHSDTQLVLTR